MNVLIYLVPLALLLGLTGLVGFMWALKNGQYDDLDGAALRILPDDDIATLSVCRLPRRLASLRFGDGCRAIRRPLIDLADFFDLVAVQSRQKARRLGLLLGRSAVDFDKCLSAGFDQKCIRAMAVAHVRFGGEKRSVARRFLDVAFLATTPRPRLGSRSRRCCRR